MQEEVIQDLHNKVQALTEAVEKQKETIEGLRIIQQRQRSDVQGVRAEGRTYSSMNAEAIEGLQDQMNNRFDMVNTRLDSQASFIKRVAEASEKNTELLNELLGILRGNLGRTHPFGEADPNEE